MYLYIINIPEVEAVMCNVVFILFLFHVLSNDPFMIGNSIQMCGQFDKMQWENNDYVENRQFCGYCVKMLNCLQFLT
jgi:hypothetical protein